MNIFAQFIVLLTSCKSDKIQNSLNVIKEMVSMQCATIELWMHLGGLLSTQEVKVALLPHATLTLLSCLATSCVHPWLDGCTLHAYHFLITKKCTTCIDYINNMSKYTKTVKQKCKQHSLKGQCTDAKSTSISTCTVYM